jgi:TNF receptor-associated protein 1
MADNKTERFEFQAEVKQVLDIVVHSLYTDKEIFIRELVSNASDASEKLRHIQLKGESVHDDNLELEIKVSTDDNAGTITIQDFGIGMTHDELIENLGTIAHSGSKTFLKALKESGERNENLIGQFGVGFYSVFMVADSVKVFTRSYRPEGESLCWSSDGSGSYEIETVEGERRGTRIVIHLKDEYKSFAGKSEAERILKRYSSFVQFPLLLNGDKLNTVQAIWLKAKSEVSDEEYKEFYKFQANAFDEPRFWLHFAADAPLTINALLYVPSENMERFGFGRMEAGVSLHCRKVLIDSDPKGLLPEWLRFLRGVIDSADLPLNISRETMQDSSLVQKLNRVITKRFLKTLEEKADKQPEEYRAFWDTFGLFLKEGVTTDYTHREQLLKLLRFESSMSEGGELTGLEDYCSRAPEGQKQIFYLSGSSRSAIEGGPYLEAFRDRKIEVLYLYEPIDEFVVNHAGEYQGKRFVSADADDLDLEAISGSVSDAPAESLDEETFKGLAEWAKQHLGERVGEVARGKRLVASPVMIVNTDKMMSAQMRKLMKAMQKDGPEMPVPAAKLELNPGHPVVRNLATLRENNPELAGQVLEQLLDSALIAAGLLEDPSEMLKRSYAMLERVSQ